MTEFPQSAARMVPATQRFAEAVANRQLTHSGDERLRRHVANAVLKVDSRGPRLSKPSKWSPRRIDLAVAAVMALERAASQGRVGQGVWVLEEVLADMHERRLKEELAELRQLDEAAKKEKHSARL